MVNRIAVVCVLGLVGWLAGCGPSGPSADFKKKAEPVVVALEKVKGDFDANPPAKTAAADVAAAQKVYDAWYNALSEEEKNVGMASILQFAMSSYSNVVIELGRKGTPLPATIKNAGDSVTKARAFLNGAKA